jgi:hypothetical protein
VERGFRGSSPVDSRIVKEEKKVSIGTQLGPQIGAEKGPL